MKLGHFSDLHYCARHLEWVDRAFGFAVDDAIERGANIAVLSGDSFDAAVDLHEPAVSAFLGRVRTLADIMPTICLAGTQSHDRPGSLNVLRTLGGEHPVFVGDEICQVALTPSGWHRSVGYAFTETDNFPVDTLMLFSILPSIDKGRIAAAVGCHDVAAAAGEMIFDICRGWSVANLQARALDIPTAVVTHGTINGAITESAQAMVSNDHEFTSGTLFAAEASAVFIGHIHAHQQFEQQGRRIAYPGSITRLIFGHEAQTGYLLWDVQPDRADFEFIATPAKRLVQIDFADAPDMAQLRQQLANADGAHVRVRWEVDEEHRSSVDKAAIEAMLRNAGAVEVKLEGRVRPIQRQRAAGITQAASLADKLRRWAEVTGTGSTACDELVERLELLQHMEPEAITEQIANKSLIVMLVDKEVAA